MITLNTTDTGTYYCPLWLAEYSRPGPTTLGYVGFFLLLVQDLQLIAFKF